MSEIIENKLPAITAGMTKSQITELAKFGVDYVLETGDPTTVAEQISAMEAYIKAVKADPRFTDYVRDELAKNRGKLTTASGAKIEAIEAGVTYDYSANPDWVALDQTIATLDVKRKALEQRLRLIPAGSVLVDESTGESYIGPAKSSKSTYRVTLAR